jgi:hypothetical protein
MGQKISALSAVGVLDPADIVPVVQSGTTKKATVAQIGGVLDQSAVAVAHAGDTTETTVATIAIPAIGANGRIAVRADFTYTNSANVKTLKVKLGGTTILTLTPSTTAGLALELFISNRNSNTSQRWSERHFFSGSLGAQFGTSAVDLSAGANLTISVQLANAGETVTLEARQVKVHSKA